MSYSVIAIWVSTFLFAILHSALSSQTSKNKCYALGISPQVYRLLYVILAIAITSVWLGFIHRLPDQVLYVIHGIWRWCLYGLQLTGLWVFFSALRPIDVLAFLGMRAFANQIEPFIETGIYRYIRHPMYSGILLIFFGMPAQSVNSLNLYVSITLYFVIGSRLEERRMLADHPEYKEYRKRVPAFIPWKIMKIKTNKTDTYH